MSGASAPSRFSQERVVFVLTATLAIAFSIGLDQFATAANLLSLLQNVSILGILAVAMGLAIIGRGIDLSIVANMAVSVAWVLSLSNGGVPIETAVLMGLGLALTIGLANGILVAYVEIPAIFATLAMASVAYGAVRSTLLDDNLIYLRGAADSWFKWIGSGQILGVPNAVLLFGLVALMAHLVLRFTVPGRFLYAMGDNPAAARTAGVAIRPLIVAQYVTVAAIAFVAGVVAATSVDSVETRIARSNLIYDVILVVVIGGIGLAGGKGAIRNVLVGTLLIGVLVNGMTIMNVAYTTQNIVKSLILLVAIMADSVLNPRDEQTSQQGDI